MNKPRRAIIPQKVPVFIGCEGQSEREYVGLLVNIIRRADLGFHLHPKDLGNGAGDPLSRLQQAATFIQHYEKIRTKFARRFVLLDRDQIMDDSVREAEAERLAKEHRITLIWQDPCFEAVLLRHLPNCSTRRPGSSNIAQSDLVKEWPGYAKPVPHASLEKRIDTAALTRVATVEPELGALLSYLKLI
jgi:hypothetical protein